MHAHAAARARHCAYAMRVRRHARRTPTPSRHSLRGWPLQPQIHLSGWRTSPTPRAILNGSKDASRSALSYSMYCNTAPSNISACACVRLCVAFATVQHCIGIIATTVAARQGSFIGAGTTGTLRLEAWRRRNMQSSCWQTVRISCSGATLSTRARETFASAGSW